MATEKTVNYTPAQEQLIRDALNEHGTLNFEIATALASNPAMDHPVDGPRKPRSVAAKISRMQLPYSRKVAVRKDGTAVASKADIVAEIGKMVSGNLEGLDKAPRPALVAVRDALAA